MRKYLALALACLVSGCALSSNYRSFGPCKGFRQDPQSCERAYQNSLVAAKIQLGQSVAQVRSTMGRDPERRAVNAASETWWYMTDYDNQKFTVIAVTQGLVSEIKQSSN